VLIGIVTAVTMRSCAVCVRAMAELTGTMNLGTHEWHCTIEGCDLFGIDADSMVVHLQTHGITVIELFGVPIPAP
jgi:hypothetical protein